MGVVVVAGASGLVGKALVSALRNRGDEVRRLVRSGPRSAGDFAWDPSVGQIPSEALAGADAVVNLGGAGIADRRWSAARRREIVASRVGPTRLLAERCAASGVPVLLNASATGFYGDRGDEPLDESAAAGAGFLASTCVAWEAASASAREAGVRVAHLRLGVVLAARGGALERMLLPFRLGAGGALGSGRQWMPWIHLHDVVGAFLHALDRPDLAGPAVVVAPEAVRQIEFARALGKVLHRPVFLATPGWVLRLALGELAQELLLSGQRCRPARLEGTGFRWAFPRLDGALEDVLARS